MTHDEVKAAMISAGWREAVKAEAELMQLYLAAHERLLAASMLRSDATLAGATAADRFYNLLVQFSAPAEAQKRAPSGRSG